MAQQGTKPEGVRMGGQCQAPKRQAHVPDPDATLSSHQNRPRRAPCTPAAHVPRMLLFVQKCLCRPGGKPVLACKIPFLTPHPPGKNK